VSVEPMLGPVNLECVQFDKYTHMNVLEGCGTSLRSPCQAIPNATCEKLNWVICGGESGPGARPMHPEWVRSLRDQCKEARVPFFFKQWGEWFPRDQWEHNPELVLPDDEFAYHNGPGTHVFKDLGDVYPVHRVGKKAAGRILDGVEYLELPEVKA
jgi:protein gp37